MIMQTNYCSLTEKCNLQCAARDILMAALVTAATAL